ncbi:MAG: hypothetical protein ACK56F_23560, partial [bacterium]
MVRQHHAVDFIRADFAVPLGVQSAHEVDAEICLYAHLKGMFLAADLDLSQLGGDPAVGRLYGEG